MSHNCDPDNSLIYNLRMCGNAASQPSNKKMLAKPGPEAIITPSGGYS